MQETKEAMSQDNKFELAAQDLRSECDPGIFDFETTDDILIDSEIIGQERAQKAIDFGLNIKSEGFNLYISGAVGTGRNTAVTRALEKIAASEPAPDDICYLYNFQNKDEPKALKLPAGLGCHLKKDLEEMTRDLEQQVIKAFSSEEYEKHKKLIINKFEEKKARLHQEAEEFAKEKGFVIQQAITGLLVVPLYKKKALTDEVYDKFPKSRKEKIEVEQGEVYEKIDEISRKVRQLQREVKNEIRDLNEKIGLYAIGHLIDDLKKKYEKYDLVTRHLGDIRDDILKNIDAFVKETEPQQMPFFLERRSKEELLNKYQVNLLVDNCNAKHAPVIIERNPTYYNLIGYVEHTMQFGVLSTDFTMIKAGSVHKANGGYLVIQAEQILRDYFAWDSLKKIILYKKIKIEEAFARYGFIPTTGLKPEAISVDLKVIVVGSPLLYRLLYIYDEEFKKLFKVKVDFDTSAKKTGESIQKYVQFIAHKAKEEKLLPFGKEAVAKIIDYASRLISHKEKLSTRFLEVADIMREADFWARREGLEGVSGAHVNKAVDEKLYRSNMLEKKIQELIEEGTLLIDASGSQTGQINGISVIDLGDYAFGCPSRITAKTFLGKGDIVNIEREAKMSGKIHSKGVLILSGYLGEKFSQDKPLALSASICFEQLYEEVEGDSASSAELYCLLSSLSGVPLRQDIAVTGSVDQRGRVQAIGGVNQKIEGFFEVCKIKGITGNQGVIIPKANARHLMLRDEVVEAARQGKFHIWAVENIDEGIEILTGIQAGKIQPDGGYPQDSVNYKVNEKLKEYASIVKSFSETKDKK